MSWGLGVWGVEGCCEDGEGLIVGGRDDRSAS